MLTTSFNFLISLSCLPNIAGRRPFNYTFMNYIRQKTSLINTKVLHHYVVKIIRVCGKCTATF